ncbi:hypothetical protein V2J09_015098 [Rumex salicifolius]
MNVAMKIKKLFRNITKLFTKSSSNSTPRGQSSFIFLLLNSLASFYLPFAIAAGILTFSFVDLFSFAHQAYKMYKKKRSQKIMDPTLEATAIEQQVVLCVHIGLLCTQSDPSLRPTMHRVHLLLSKAPSTSSLEDPTRPTGLTRTRYRRPRRPRASSSNASTSSTPNTASFISSAGTVISEASTSTAGSSNQFYITKGMQVENNT